jgi:AraC-like DNA-binding protein
MRSVSLKEVQQGIAAGLRGRGAASRLVARDLFCSESTLHRVLRRHGTTYAAERNRVRTDMAVSLLKAGTPVATVASEVEVTPDYLRRLVVAKVWMTPANIARAANLADALAKPPERLSDLAQRGGAERRLDALVGDLPSEHPLAGWAKDLLWRTYLPETETQEFYAELLRRHRKERAARRDEGDMRRLELGLVDTGPPEPLTPEEEAFQRVARGMQLAAWRRRQRNYRSLRPT